jgi:hypothetical protein
MAMDNSRLAADKMSAPPQECEKRTLIPMVLSFR